MFLNRCMLSASRFVLIKQHSITFMSNHMCWNIQICVYWHICRTTCNNLFMIKLNYLINGSNFKSVPGGNSPDGEIPSAQSHSQAEGRTDLCPIWTLLGSAVCVSSAHDGELPSPRVLLPPHPYFKCLVTALSKAGSQTGTEPWLFYFYGILDSHAHCFAY